MAIINGTNVEGSPKQAVTKVNKKELTLTLVYVADTEVTHGFDWVPFKGVQATSQKAGNRVATTLKAGNKVIFTNLTAQSVFAVIEAKYGQSQSATNNLYKRANTARKESKQGGAAKVTVEAGKEGW